MSEFLKEMSVEEALSRRVSPVSRDVLLRAAEIVDDVRVRGTEALHEWSRRLGDLEEGDVWRFDRSALAEAKDEVDPGVLELLERTAGRIERFASAQRAALVDMEVEVQGGRAGHTVRPVGAAGCYAPGGRFPLPSSVLMTAVTAKVAGVNRVVVASPKPTAVTRAAASVAGADELTAVGGAQAIAALAYGVEDFGPVDVVVCPGNSWVTAAKKWVMGDVGIDMLAGPSELLVIADDSASAGVVASDLIAQAEHDPEAVPALVCRSRQFIDTVRAELGRQLADLPTADNAKAALRNGFSVVVDSLEEAAAVSDRVAPEHLELLVEEPSRLAGMVSCYGGLFIGSGSAEVFGDYGLGPNHVLPTGGSGRFTGGLSVSNFLVTRTWLELDVVADDVADDVTRLARLEGLEGHARAAERRR
jgi:phosphoribosyl-ATP pyrophosphohydrolase/phosphoribosyl-AMP cyclohydrolase/histidinol dehydrogenase